jgi:deoxyribonuclease V
LKVKELHSWKVTPDQAKSIQNRLRSKIVKHDDFEEIHKVAGVDIGLHHKQTKARAAVVILSYPDLELIEQQLSEMSLEMPYIPGLLSFREIPPLIKAFEKVTNEPDLVIADGQGIAHPRRLGLASHLGLIIDKPTIGCAKSVLCGEYEKPDKKAGSTSYLYDDDEIIGAAVRTRTNVNCVFISIGHEISLESAIHYTLKCCTKYKLPQTTRLAHRLASRKT